jgi:hypothetical protein
VRVKVVILRERSDRRISPELNSVTDEILRYAQNDRRRRRNSNILAFGFILDLFRICSLDFSILRLLG